MRRFRISPEAADNIREIWEFIAEDDVSAAREYAKTFLMRFVVLLRCRGKATREKIYRQAGTLLAVHAYLIVYRPDTDPLEIVAVLHGARDIQRLL